MPSGLQSADELVRDRGDHVDNGEFQNVSRPTANGSSAKGNPEDLQEFALIRSASRWIDDALRAWSEDDHAKLAALAPLAVEHLGKAVLWRRNPALLVPLSQDAEPALVLLATNPDLASPKLRTVGLAPLLGRLERLMGTLPLEPKQRKRLVEVRNGAMHVGSAAQSRHVLLDALSMCQVLLDHLGEDSEAFFGDHYRSVVELLDQKRSEVGHQVAAKRARARRRLGELEERLGEELFAETCARLEEQAPFVLDPSDFGEDLNAVESACPECGSAGRLIGRVDVTEEVDFDVEPLGGGQYNTVPYGYLAVALVPQAFACNVCQVSLHGVAELAEAGLPSNPHEVAPEDLGGDFDLETYRHEFGPDEW
ncbi:MAG TPA: hypothetical protein VNT31_00420 [Nocardioides sp.]|nr:hypothetical protein [Nocardioides sp.]